MLSTPYNTSDPTNPHFFVSTISILTSPYDSDVISNAIEQYENISTNDTTYPLYNPFVIYSLH
jgi:hypothetical protein